jgi:hypothetical protein
LCRPFLLLAFFAVRGAVFFLDIIATVGTIIEGAAGQSIPTVERMQRLANRPRGRFRFNTLLVSVGLKEPSSCRPRRDIACRAPVLTVLDTHSRCAILNNY